MPDITITVSQKLIDRAQVLTDKHNARTGENLTPLQLAAQILKSWAAGEAVGAAITTAMQDFDDDREEQRVAAITSASDAELANW
ncbi:hypothetical protein LCGC14_1346290 [marine sediment metagenome]|uniref:Uncharacterized protein n=1 Tax=marine sediment metagenome TaxID=412755 RepID=A0A0F9KCX9_9ZZZZ